MIQDPGGPSRAPAIPSGSMERITHNRNGGTLNEPIRTTIMRDIESIKKKLSFILYPSSDRSVEGLSRDWELWGPSVLCLALSSVLAYTAPDSQKGYVFALVYTYVWLGSGLVTLNALLLKGNISFFQSVCVLGYCILPLVIAAFAGLILDFFIIGVLNKVIRAGFVLVALGWSSKSSVGFMSGLVPDDRSALAVYPVWLLYVAIGWIIFLAGV